MVAWTKGRQHAFQKCSHFQSLICSASVHRRTNSLRTEGDIETFICYRLRHDSLREGPSTHPFRDISVGAFTSMKSNTCIGKESGEPVTVYQSKYQAQLAANHVNATYRKQMLPYQCKKCGLWHLRKWLASNKRLKLLAVLRPYQAHTGGDKSCFAASPLGASGRWATQGNQPDSVFSCRSPSPAPGSPRVRDRPG